MSRQIGKKILTDMLGMSHEALKKTWASFTPSEREIFYGVGKGSHADEIDGLTKQLGTKPTDHLADDAFGEHLHALHSGDGMHDEHAASVLHTPSGIRLAQNAVTMKPGSVPHNTTMAILNARYSAAKKQAMADQANIA